MTRRPNPDPEDWAPDRILALVLVVVGWMLITGGVVQATGARWLWLVSVGAMFLTAGGGWIAVLAILKRRGLG